MIEAYDNIIFDLDGTLFDIEARRQAARKENGKINFDILYDSKLVTELDKPNWPIINIFKTLPGKKYIFSGRCESTRFATQRWLQQVGIQPVKMLMRPEEEYMPDDELKEMWLNQLFPDRNVAMVFDDRDKVVAMWRRNNITCLQVAYGDF